MPIQTAWEDSQRTIVRLTVQDPWTLKDFHTELVRVYEMIADNPTTIDALIDFSEASVRDELTEVSAVPAYAGVNVVVGSREQMRPLGAMLRRLSSLRFHFLPDEQLAVQFIREAQKQRT